MTKLLHVSDTHLGNRQYRSDIRRDDFANAFDAAVDIAIDEDVDAVVHTGDLFDDPSPNVPTVNRALDTVSRLGDADIPFLGIVGNHERKREEQWMDLVGRFGHAERLGPTPRRVTDESGEDPVDVYGFDAVRSPAWEATDFSLHEFDESAYSLVCMHELFEPLVPPHRGADYHLDEFVPRLDPRPDALALGDYHSTCNTEVGGVEAFYPGATERTSVSETTSPAVYVLEIEDGSLQRRTRTVESAGRDHVPRDVVVVEVEFEEGHGIEYVERRVEEDTGTEGLDDKLVVVRLRGEDVPVTTNEVYTLLNRKGAAVPHVDDKRTVDVELDFDLDAGEGKDTDQMIDEELGELTLSKLALEAEDIARDEVVETGKIREEMNRRIRAAQEDEFGEATLEER